MDIKYRLESLNETEFKMDYDFDYSSLNPSEVQIQVGQEIKPIIENNKVVIKAKATLTYGDHDKLLATTSIMTTFGLSPIKDIITINEDGSFTSQDSLIIDTFLTTSIGALRGIMYKNFKGTTLESFIIPLIPIEHFRR